MVNRDDAFGGHYVGADGSTKRTTRKDRLDRQTLTTHFCGEVVEHIIGIHAASRDGTSRWVCVDIDRHGDDGDPAVNFQFARLVQDIAGGAGLACRLLDSNGRGGFHIWVLLHAPVPVADAWRLGRWLTRHHGEWGHDKPPESFPKSPKLSGKGYGTWVRLPGRHHKRPHWTRVWGASRRSGWAEGQEAVDSLLAFKDRPVDLSRMIPASFTGKPARMVAPRPSSPRTYHGDDRFEIARARSALFALGEQDYEDYDSWLRVGMALKGLGDAGLDLWHEWSEQGSGYDSDVLTQKWETFNVGDGDTGVTLGSLYFWAKQAGWSGADETSETGDDGVIRTHDRSGRKGEIRIPVRKIQT
jgi:hypothetical protein